jgi:hypothetical protein
MLNDQHKALIDKLSQIKNFQEEFQKLIAASEQRLKEIKDVEVAIQKLVEEKTQGFPWLADAISQYHEYRDLKIAEFLEKKLMPAVASAERVKELAGEKRELQKKFLVTRNLIRYYEALFPWLSDFVGEDVDELIVAAIQESKVEEEQADPVRVFLTAGEFEQLSNAERNQRALDRYWASRKSPWQIGRDYERYVGYLYEQKGFSVRYQGIEKGLEDLGRDLICKKGDRVEIVQCKNWRKDKTIHEKHINQLFGTTVMFFIQNLKLAGPLELNLFPSLLKQKQISATLYTSARLSETAREFSRILNVTIFEAFPFKKYPSIKCNVSMRDGTRIYHLPFDQQYDRTIVHEERSECYVETVAEAELLGFRRAWRWRGAKESS